MLGDTPDRKDNPMPTDGYIGYDLDIDDRTATTIHVYVAADRGDHRGPRPGATPVTVIGPYRGRAHNARAWARFERIVTALMRQPS